MTSIWSRRLDLEKARRVKMREAMQEYDKNVYDPAMQALRDECAAAGHVWTFSHLNMFGMPCEVCNFCKTPRGQLCPTN